MKDSGLDPSSSTQGAPFVLPASFGQARLWFLEQYEPETGIYNLPFALRLRGALHIGAVEHAIDDLIARHEALRTTFAVQDDVLVQVVAPALHVDVRLHEIPPHVEAATEVERLLDREATTPFDLVHGPLVRAMLVRLASDEHVLHLTLHHIVGDGWSIDVLAHELAVLYDARARGVEPSLAPIRLHYGDFAAWQRETMVGDVLRDHLDYWRRVLDGAPPSSALPVDAPRRSKERTRRARAARLRLDAKRARELRGVAAKHRATPFMVFAAAYATLLQRHSAQDDFLLGYPVANRNRAELEDVVGFFVNTLVLRVRRRPEMTFAHLLAETREAILDADAHQDLPFDLLVKHLAPERDGAQPLFRAMLVMQSTVARPLDVPSLEITVLPDRTTFAKFDLVLSLTERGDELEGVLEYDVDLFDDAAGERLVGQLDELLRSACERPVATLDSLPLTSARERADWFARSSAELPDLAPAACLHELFEGEASAHPNAPAITHEGTTLTYAELNARANRLAHLLLASSMRDEAPVAIAMQRSIDAIVAILAVLKSGRAYVPIDPDCPAERVRFMLEDADAALLLTDRATLASPSMKLEAGAGPRTIVFDGPDAASALERCASGNPRVGVSRDAAAYIIYTSGSTGAPKGCVVSHRNVTRLFAAARPHFDFDASDVWTLFHSIAFDFSVWEIWGALSSGARLVVVPFWATRSVDDFLRLLIDERVTILNQTPSFFAELAATAVDTRALVGSPLRYVVFGGEKLDCRALARWFAVHGDARPTLVNMYGITETTVHVTVRPIAASDVESGRSVIGHPLGDLRVHLLDANLTPVPVGVPGEIVVEGAGVCSGYLRRPELTAARFVAAPWGNGRLYRSGDLARRLPNGELEYLGRSDAQVKIRGFRVELGEIEAALTSFSEIAVAAVVVSDVPHPALIGYVILRGSSSPEAFEALAASILTDLRARLPPYMVPTRLVRLDALPLTTNGKLDVRALPRDLPPSPNTTYEPPATPEEDVLASIWRALLGCPRVGRHDNFFALGGDSIVSLQVVSRARKRGIALTARALFEHPTIAGVLAARTVEDRALPIERVDDAIALAPIQRWFLESQPREELHHFVFWTTLRVPGAVSATALRALARQLLEAHDALRLRFEATSSGYVARDESPSDSLAQRTVAIVDVRALPDAASRAASAAVHRRASFSTLDPARGPLLKLILYPGLDEGAGHLTILAHHLVVDGVSWRILLDDITTALEALARGDRPSFGAATTPFRAWTRRLSAYASSDALRRERDHWLRALRHVRSIPIDGEEEVDTRITDVRYVDASLTTAETRALLTACPSTFHAKIDDVLLAGLLIAARRSWGVERLVVDLEGHGREEIDPTIDLSNTVGWFTTKYPVVLDGSNGTWRASDVVSAVRSSLASVPRRGIGYGALRYLARDEAVISAEAERPVPICFNYLGQWSTASGETSFVSAPLETSCSPTLRSQYLLDINAHVVDGVLHFSFGYDERRHRTSTIATFAKHYVDALRAMIAASHDAASLEDAYPATPMQQGMLFHTLSSDPSAYVVQYRYRLDGIDADRLRRALARLVARHPVLRSCFVESAEDGVRQIVHREVPLPLTYLDARDGTSVDLEATLASDAFAPFVLSRPPLLRFTLIRTTASSYVLAWSFHHAIADGWSMALLVDELREAYDEPTRATPPVVPHRRYVDWLLRQDKARAREHWRAILRGAPSTAISTEGTAPSLARASSLVRRTYDAGASFDLTQRARALGTTLNTLFQAALALALASLTNTEDVVFGVTSSGRHPSIDDVELIIGPLITTVPIRVRCDVEGSVGDWLRALRLQQVEADEHAHLPLTEMHALTDTRRGRALFDVLLVFQNYPSHRAGAQRGWTMSEIGGRDEPHYPVTVVVTPGERTRLEIAYRDNVSPAVAEALASRMCAHLDAMITMDLRRPLRDLTSAITPEAGPSPTRTP